MVVPIPPAEGVRVGKAGIITRSTQKATSRKWVTEEKIKMKR
jgi:hypothetical protein